MVGSIPVVVTRPSVEAVAPVAAAPARTAASARSTHLEAIRGLAALMVLVVHVGFLTGAEGVPGYVDSGFHQLLRHSLTDGVVLFFALSGYLVGGPFLRSLLAGGRPVDVTGYGMRRAARILPAYWVALAALLLLAPPVAGFSGWQVASHALLLQNAFPGEAQTMLAVAWTLCIEAFFYVLMPVAAFALRRRHRGPVGAGRLALIVCSVWAGSAVFGLVVDRLLGGTSWWAPLALNLPFFVGLFCPGMLIALAEARPPDLRGTVDCVARFVGRHPLLLAPPCLLLFGASAWLLGAPTLWVARLHYQVAALGSGVALIIALRARHAHRSAVRLLAGLGTLSYGIYLWHWVVLGVLIRHQVKVPGGQGWHAWITGSALLLSLTLPLAAASWLLVERPAQRWAQAWVRRHERRRFSQPRTARTAVPGGAALRGARAGNALPRPILAAAILGGVAGAVAALSLNHGVADRALAREQAVPPPPPPPPLLGDPRPVVAVGDSLTLSWGVPVTQSYPVALGKVLGEPVIALPYNGKMAWEVVPRLAEVLAVNPKLVVVEFGTNEANVGKPISYAISGLETILSTLDAHHVAVVLVGTHVDHDHLARNLVGTAYATYGAQWDRALEALAARHHAGLVVDVLGGLAVQRDGYHPLAAGYAVMGNRVAEAVRARELSRF
jgi:peptidoglycan/LPS O-acetylase OafA/YrhL/lysophospholipase L1-like esterase